MKIHIIGKSHLEGVSKKTGRPYNFNQVHYNSPSRGVEGLAAMVQAIDPAIAPIDMIRVGCDYDIEFDQRGFVIGFEPVK